MVKRKRIENNPLERNPEFQLSMHQLNARVEITLTIIKSLKPVAIVGLIGFFGWKIAESISGGDTTFSFILKLISDRYFSYIITLLVVVTTGGWAGVERFLRIKSAKRHGQRVSELEKKLDKNKKSSLISESGETQRGD